MKRLTLTTLTLGILAFMSVFTAHAKTGKADTDFYTGGGIGMIIPFNQECSNHKTKCNVEPDFGGTIFLGIEDIWKNLNLELSASHHSNIMREPPKEISGYEGDITGNITFVSISALKMIPIDDDTDAYIRAGIYNIFDSSSKIIYKDPKMPDPNPELKNTETLAWVGYWG